MESNEQKTPSLYDNRMPTAVTTFDEENYIESPSRRVVNVPALPTSFPPTFLTTASKHQTASNQEHCSKWIIENPPVLPDLYPLEPTSVFVIQTHSCMIGERISCILKERSIQCDFFGNEAKCLTADNVHFCVFIYRGRDPLFSHGIIVEVQRRSGISINYFKHVKAILLAAEGKTVAFEEDIDDPSFNLFIDEDQSESNRTSLDYVIKIINTHGCERLGLRILIVLTDATKVGQKVAKNAVLTLNEHNIGLKIVDYLKIDELKPLSFLVLKNILHHNAAVRDVAAMLSPILLDEIQNAASAPQMAFLATKCLEPLLLDQGVKSMGEFQRILDNAVYVGGFRHQGLALQAQRCLLRLEQDQCESIDK